jgi:GTP diphosphokinase / guanosine-3',5'-bis(diphosphate) 3'-diphosphatase
MQNRLSAPKVSPEEIFLKLIENNARLKEEDIPEVRKAFELAQTVHQNMYRLSGEPYIYHPLEVAKIVSKEIKLGKTATICALLHDVIDNSEYTADDIRAIFGEKIGYICSGLAKVPEREGSPAEIKAENFRKLLLTLSDDVRVILIKLAERLHNMRTIDSMPEERKQRLANETLDLFAPLAHRLGVYKIKTELEELSFKALHPTEFAEITQKLHKTEKQRVHLINRFSIPISHKLIRKGIKFNITGRTKSIFSIWNKMQKKKVPFEEVYDVLAIRIIFEPNPNEPEDLQCFAIYKDVIQMYPPMPERLRDWVTQPKENGYEALHITVQGPEGRWVEVQIRSKRMDELAELGFAAHYKYKGVDAVETTIDKWIKKMKSVLENPDSNALRFIDRFKLNMFSNEILVFTPKGDIITLPQNATVIDFAFTIHSELGMHCIGAQIGQKIVPPNHILHSGDKVKIITSSKEAIKPEWLDFAISDKTKEKIQDYLNQERKNPLDVGKEILESIFIELSVQPSSEIIKDLIEKYQSKSKSQLYQNIGKNEISKTELKEYLTKYKKKKVKNYWMIRFTKSLVGLGTKGKSESKQIGNPEFTNHTSKPARCCNPIPGDAVVGILESDNTITVHKNNCPIAAQSIKQKPELFIKATWQSFTLESFLAKIKIQGLDKRGLIMNISSVLTTELRVNIKSFHIDTENGLFNCSISLYLHNIEDLNSLISSLKKIDGVKSVERDEEITTI